MLKNNTVIYKGTFLVDLTPLTIYNLKTHCTCALCLMHHCHLCAPKTHGLKHMEKKMSDHSVSIKIIPFTHISCNSQNFLPNISEGLYSNVYLKGVKWFQKHSCELWNKGSVISLSLKLWCVSFAVIRLHRRWKGTAESETLPSTRCCFKMSEMCTRCQLLVPACLWPR